MQVAESFFYYMKVFYYMLLISSDYETLYFLEIEEGLY